MLERYIKEGDEIKPNPLYLIPNKVVLNFFQQWGQLLQDRVDALNEAIELAGFTGVRAEVTDSGWSIYGPEEKMELFKQFYRELKGCYPKGQFEWEEEAVRQTIVKYQELTKR